MVKSLKFVLFLQRLLICRTRYVVIRFINMNAYSEKNIFFLV